MGTTIDHDRARELATEVLQATESPFCIRWHDDTLGATHGAVLGGEHQEPLHRANLETALELLADHVESGDVSEATVGRSGATWLTFLAVRVLDDDGELARSWLDYVELVHEPLEDYPVLDEERWSELEYEELVEHVGYCAGDDELAELLLARFFETGAGSTVEEYDHDDEVLALARELWEDGTEVTEDVGEALAENLRTLARRQQWDVSHAERAGRDTTHARAAVIEAEALADHFEPEEL